MQESHWLDQAKRMIAEAKNAEYTPSERAEKAIELAGLMLNQAKKIETSQEKAMQKQLALMMNDQHGKVFTTQVTDQCFRSNRPERIADQLTYLIEKYGIPNYLSYWRRCQLSIFKGLGKIFPAIFVPLVKKALRRETSKVILPGETNQMAKHLEIRKKEGIRVNLNHLGEAILGEQEAERRVEDYLNDLANPDVEYISVKISTISSQLNLIAWEDSLEILISRLKQLYRKAIEIPYIKSEGSSIPKFVNLDMEEYKDLHLTVDLFQKTLEDPEFFHYSAGIVLQSYIPDSFFIQQQLTDWARDRLEKGGAPIKIRIVKGANLAMEQVEASLRSWEQAPYLSKSEVDANFKRMVTYGCKKENTAAANLGIGSHNLFDIAYALLLRAQNGVEKFVCFEMLEGMADHTRRVVQYLSGDMLLYCPVAKKEEFQNAVAYLVRRLDENTAPENFLRHSFSLIPGNREWFQQAELFRKACQNVDKVSCQPRRIQNRFHSPLRPENNNIFTNEPDTDFSLPQNRVWAENIKKEWSNKTLQVIPLVINGKEMADGRTGRGIDPSNPEKIYFEYTLADKGLIEQALDCAVKAQKAWQNKPLQERSKILKEAAHRLRCDRDSLIGAMLGNTGKVINEGDVEVSEAVDFIEYYSQNREELEGLQDITWQPKGTVLVAPPWNFPCSIPTGGIAAALAAGNAVIFKPAPESILVGWYLAKCFWDAGISKELLQFIACDDDTIGSYLVKHPLLNCVILTGATSTAKLFLKMRPGIDLLAETGGKNAMIITSLSDRDLAIKDLVQSAFGHAGQKCSACSLAICEAEVYDDPHFREHLKDAVQSWKVGSPWDLATRLNPLIRPPNPLLKKSLTTLEEGEEWLLKPVQHPENPHLWSPGIKLGVKEGSFTHQNEFFGPLLAIMRAENLSQAIKMANGTKYGLTSGLHSLDEREQDYWTKHIEAGNCYINRGITGAVVQRQSFGGCKESSFGPGAKAGGPNYLLQLMHAEQSSLPQEKETPSDSVQAFSEFYLKNYLNNSQEDLWNASLESYAFFWNHYFSQDHDPSHLKGEDNILRYLPHEWLAIRIQAADSFVDIGRAIAAAMTCNTPVEISLDKNFTSHFKNTLQKYVNKINVIFETAGEFGSRISNEIKKVRLLSQPDAELQNALAECNVYVSPILANGRLELPHYLREVIISVDYHRYGSLGEREGEFNIEKKEDSCCQKGGCGSCS